VKIAVTGKGGVGKTSLTSLLANAYAAEGRQVIAIDANPDANLAGALGIPADVASTITPIADLEELIKERTGVEGTADTFFKLNPKVDDLVDRYGLRKGNIRLAVMGTVRRGGGGCMCGESALIRNLVSHLVLGRKEMVVMDMDAGLEHMGRGTAKGVDALIVVVEPGQRSVQTARSILKLAKDINVKKVYVVGSKTKTDDDRDFIVKNLPEFEVLGFINYHLDVAEADRRGLSVYESSPEAVVDVGVIKRRLDELQEKDK